MPGLVRYYSGTEPANRIMGVIAINQQQFRLCEECLFIRKHLPRRIVDLEIYIESIMPPLPGSVLKLVGRPVAKNPFDTSQTERWAIKRACCEEAAELSAKRELHYQLDQFIGELKGKEAQFVRLVYDRELPVQSVVRELGIVYRTYSRLRQKVVIKVWDRLKSMNGQIELGVK